MEKPKYQRVQSYGSMCSSRSDDDMIIHSPLYPIPKKMILESEILYEEEHPPFVPLIATSKWFGKARCSYLLFGYVLFYIIYLVTGALVFSALEAPIENQIRLDVIRAKRDFLIKYPNVVDEDLEAFLSEVVQASGRGVSAAGNVTGGPNWSFSQALFFSSTVITTVGYGHVTPLTNAGKMFCMLYAMLGIPLTLILLSAMVEKMITPATYMLQTFNSSLGHLFRPFTIRLLHLITMVTILLIICALIPAAVFSYLEPEWNYLDSLYFCFISLTTIGLGDYIPGDSPDQHYRDLYKIGVSIYLFLGLTALMMVLTVFYDIPQLNFSTVFSSVNLENNDPEKMRLSGVMGPGYGIGGLMMRDEYTQEQRRSVVHIRPHRDDSPSPDDTTPVHARDLRVH